MKQTFSIKKDSMFSLLVWWIWSQSFLVQYVRAIIMQIPFIGAYPDAVLTIAFVMVMLAALPSYRITKGDMIFLFAVVGIFTFQWIFHSEAQEYMNRYMVFFVLEILPLYVVGVSLGTSKNQEKIIHVMYILSIITLIVDLFYKLVISTPMSAIASQYEGDMDRAYKILPHCCLIAYHAVKKTNPWNIAFSVIGGIYLLLLGTRGAALIYLLLITLLLIMGRSSTGAIIRIVLVASAVAAFLMSSLFEATVLWLSQLAQSLGLSIRIFDKLLSGKLGASSGRDIIQTTLLDAIAKGPVFGYGLCMDRVLAGNYAHNIAIELWIEFGIIFGSIILIVLISILIRGYLKAENGGEKGLIMVLFFSAFCMLFLSGSYLDNRFLMFLLGMCVCSIRKAKRMRKLSI